MSNHTIHLSGVDNLGLCVLVEHPTGVVWQNQVGGVAVIPMSLEGVLIPLPGRTPVEADVGSLDPYVFAEWGPRTPDPLYNHSPYSDDAIPFEARIDGWLQWSGYHTVFEPRLEHWMVAEAWIPVWVRKDLPEDHLLAQWGGHRAVLTYQNSD